jgi:solute carrier family 35 protein E3
MIPLCSFFAGFLILGNFSLAYNSVGFYQYVLCQAKLGVTNLWAFAGRLAKIMTTPCVAILQYFFLSKLISFQTAFAIAAVCVGVGLTNTSSSAVTTTFGASIAIAAFTVTAFYQVWIGKKMKDFAVSSPQLLLNQAPISVLLLAFLAPFMDTVPNLQKIPRDTIIALVLSGLAAASLVSLVTKLRKGKERC